MKKKKGFFVQLKRLGIVFMMLAIAIAGYVAVVNRNSADMTIRQKILKAFYPALTGITQLFGRHDRVLKNEKQVRAPHSFYDLTLVQNNGDPLPLSAYKGKKVLLVNTASDCGYTAQYDDLQQLYETYKDKLVVIGFPANDFKEQEKGSDEEIAKFCRLNFGVSFPLAKKSSVRRGEEQNPVFRWLTDKQYNGWNDRAPVWNFTKYLVNEEGMLTAYFEPSVSPLSETVVGAVKK